MKKQTRCWIIFSRLCTETAKLLIALLCFCWTTNIFLFVFLLLLLKMRNSITSFYLFSLFLVFLVNKSYAIRDYTVPAKQVCKCVQCQRKKKMFLRWRFSFVGSTWEMTLLSHFSPFFYFYFSFVFNTDVPESGVGHCLFRNQVVHGDFNDVITWKLTCRHRRNLDQLKTNIHVQEEREKVLATSLSWITFSAKDAIHLLSLLPFFLFPVLLFCFLM